jgi:hypothetical protein
MIPAKIDVTFVSARAKRIPGIELSRSETTQIWKRVLGARGRWIPRIREIMKRVTAPSAHRPKATPKGVRNSRPSLMKIKEQPQMKPTVR